MSLDQPENFVKHQTLTHDRFLGGRITVSQPRQGFRAGLDSVLLGASVPASAETLLDLGAGVGAASLVALAWNPDLSATLVEIDQTTLALAETNLQSNGFFDRAKSVLLDITARGATRAQAGLPVDHFDVVIANPPFFETAAGTLSQAPGRAGARHMSGGSLDLWVKTAAASAAPGETITFIFPASGLAPLLAAFALRFGAITILPLLPRPEAPASRILVRAIKGSRAPLTLCAARSLHAEDGRAFTPEFDAILRGSARLDW